MRRRARSVFFTLVHLPFGANLAESSRHVKVERQKWLPPRGRARGSARGRDPEEARRLGRCWPRAPVGGGDVDPRPLRPAAPPSVRRDTGHGGVAANADSLASGSCPPEGAAGTPSTGEEPGDTLCFRAIAGCLGRGHGLRERARARSELQRPRRRLHAAGVPGHGRARRPRHRGGRHRPRRLLEHALQLPLGDLGCATAPEACP